MYLSCFDAMLPAVLLILWCLAGVEGTGATEPDIAAHIWQGPYPAHSVLRAALRQDDGHRLLPWIDLHAMVSWGVSTNVMFSMVLSGPVLLHRGGFSILLGAPASSLASYLALVSYPAVWSWCCLRGRQQLNKPHLHPACSAC